MQFEIVRNDIVKIKVDILVNSANPYPIIGSGVDRALHKMAGEEMLADRKIIGVMEEGQVEMTRGYGLAGDYVIHVVAPRWTDGKRGELELLAACYNKALAMAKKMGAMSIAFPLLSSGNYGIPKEKALKVATTCIREFLLREEMKIYLVVYDKKSFKLSKNLAKEVKEYIDDYYVENNLLDAEDCQKMYSAKEVGFKRENHSFHVELEDSFSTTLLKLIDERGEEDTQVYKRANVDRRLFSKIRSNPNYQPSKSTAFAFAIALELSLDQCKDLLSRAGFALNPSSSFDLIIEYAIKNEIYDIFAINEILFEFDQKLIGG